MDIEEDYRAILRRHSARGVITDVADNLVGYPFVRVAQEARRTGKTAQAIYTVVARLVELGILEQAGRRATYDRTFAAPRVLEIFAGPIRVAATTSAFTACGVCDTLARAR